MRPLYRKHTPEEWQEARRVLDAWYDQGIYKQPVKSSNGEIGTLVEWLLEKNGWGSEWTALYENGQYQMIWMYY